MKRIIHFFLSFCLFTDITILPQIPDLEVIANKIWHNECNGTLEGLTFWNKNENFPSMGIGHFIWYHKGQQEPFEQTFPSLINFMKNKGAKLPQWLENNLDCPWRSRDAFYEQFNSETMQQLRAFLKETKLLQAAFIVERLKKTIESIELAVSQDKRETVLAHIKQLLGTTHGLFALLDYLHFKGSGLNPSECYREHRWGLLQVLEGMGNTENSLAEFVASAKRVLEQRAILAGPSSNAKNWLPGWINRIDRYLI